MEAQLMWEILQYSKVGVRNRENGLPCQDYVYHLEKYPIQAIALADGTGEDDFARMGAKCSCKTLARFLVEHFDELYEMENSLVQFHIITNIQTKLYDLCNQYHLDLKSFHSTLLGVVIDNDRGRFMAVHLGDGSIGIKRSGKIVTISYPANGVNKSRTYLTSEHKVGKHIKIIRDEIKDIKEFILVSDGWEEKTDEKYSFIQEELNGKTDKSKYMDDVSFIALRKD